MKVLYILIIVCMFIIIYQDFKYRSLSLMVLVSSLLMIIINSVAINGWKDTISYAGINLLLVAVQLIGVTVYFSIKHKKFVHITNHYLGSGDIWFYGILAFSFSPLNFVVFNLISYVMILISFAMAGFVKRQNNTIPLAGCLAIAMIVVIAGSYVWKGVNMYDDWGVVTAFFAG